MASSVPIRSSPPRTEPFLELFLELVPHGELTPKLWTLRVGDAVSLRPRPKGVFTLEEKFPVHLMVATATGIAPFVSMLRHVIHHGERGGGRRGHVPVAWGRPSYIKTGEVLGPPAPRGVASYTVRVRAPATRARGVVVGHAGARGSLGGR